MEAPRPPVRATYALWVNYVWLVLCYTLLHETTAYIFPLGTREPIQQCGELRYYPLCSASSDNHSLCQWCTYRTCPVVLMNLMYPDSGRPLCTQ